MHTLKFLLKALDMVVMITVLGAIILGTLAIVAAIAGTAFLAFDNASAEGAQKAVWITLAITGYFGAALLYDKAENWLYDRQHPARWRNYRQSVLQEHPDNLKRQTELLDLRLYEDYLKFDKPGEDELFARRHNMTIDFMLDRLKIGSQLKQAGQQL